MSLRPRAGSLAAASPPSLGDFGPKSFTGGPLSPSHAPSSPFLHLASVSARINSLTVPEKGHFFVSLHLRKDDHIVDSVLRSRTEVSSNSRRIIQFNTNTFTFDARAIPSGRTSSSSVLYNHQGFLHRSTSTLSPSALLGDPASGLELSVLVYQVYPRDDDDQGFSKLCAVGRLPLSSLAQHANVHDKDDNDTPASHSSVETPTGRLTRQASSASNHQTDDSEDESGYSTSIPLVHYLDEDDDDLSIRHSDPESAHVTTEETENIEFGRLAISLELRRRVRIAKHAQRRSFTCLMHPRMLFACFGTLNPTLKTKNKHFFEIFTSWPTVLFAQNWRLFPLYEKHPLASSPFERASQLGF